MATRHRATTVAIVGAGSVGCYFGALLAQAGTGVTLIGRPQHVEAIRAGGLVLERGAGREILAVQATVEVAAVADAKAVLVCVKSGDTETVARAMAPHLRADTTIFSLQNGADNADRLQAVLGRPVVPVVVYVAAEMAGPGYVRHHGRGELVLGPGPGSADLAALFSAAGVPATISERVVDALWSKLILNCAYNPLSALTGMPYGRMLAMPGIADVMRDVVSECTAVAVASGIVVPDTLLADVLGLAQTMPDQVSSTAQDLRRGKPSEIDHLNGLVIRKGETLGIQTPANRVLYALLKVAESGGPPER